jgi:hypothetical protein
MISLVVIVLAVFVIFVSYIFFYRNLKVFRYRQKIIMNIDAAAKDDIARGFYNEWTHRWTAYDTISYDEMVYKFWRPLDSFLPEDKSFMEKRP